MLPSLREAAPSRWTRFKRKRPAGLHGGLVPDFPMIARTVGKGTIEEDGLGFKDLVEKTAARGRSSAFFSKQPMVGKPILVEAPRVGVCKAA